PPGRRGSASQPFAPPFSGDNVFAVVFNHARGIKPDPEAARTAPTGFAEPRPERVVNAKMWARWRPLGSSAGTPIARGGASVYTALPRAERSRPWRWALSSAVEHYLDMVGVRGSIPLAPTISASP